LILLTGVPGSTQRDVVGVTVFSDTPTEFLGPDTPGAFAPVVLWMGE
jgi:hypothetical protein